MLIIIKVDQIYEKIIQKKGSSVREIPAANVFYFELNPDFSIPAKTGFSKWKVREEYWFDV